MSPVMILGLLLLTLLVSISFWVFTAREPQDIDEEETVSVFAESNAQRHQMMEHISHKTEEEKEEDLDYFSHK